MYYLVIERIKKSVDVDLVKKLAEKHEKWVNDNLDNEKIVQCGRWGNVGGVIIFKYDSIEEVENELKNDPFVKENVVEFEVNEFSPAREFK